MRIRKLLTWVILAMILGIVVMLLILSLLLNTSWGAGIVSAQVSKLVPGRLSWSSIHFNPVKLIVDVQDFKTIALDSTTEVISVESVRLNVSGSALLAGKFRVTHLDIKDVSVLIAFDSLGNLSLAQAFARPDSIPKVKKPFNAQIFLNKGIIPLRVDTFTISNADVRYVDERFDMDIYLQKALLKGSCNLKKLTASLSIETPKVHVGIPAFTSDYDTLSLSIIGSPRHVSSLGIYFANAQDTVRLNGSGSDFLFLDKSAVDLVLQGKVDVEKLFTSLRLDIGGTGRAKVKAHISERIADPTLKLSAYYVGTDMAHTALRRCFFSLHHKQRQGHIDSLFVTDSFGTKLRLEGNYSIVPLFPVDFFHPYQSEGLKSMTYDATIKILDATYPLTPELLLTAGSGNVKVKGLGVLPDFMDAQIDLSTKGVLRLHHKSPSKATVAAEIAVLNGTYSWKNLLVGFQGAPLVQGEGELNLAQKSIHTTLSFDTVSLAPLTRLFSLPLAGIASGYISAEGLYMAPSLKVALRGKDITYDSLHVDSLTLMMSTKSDKGEIVGDVEVYQEGGTLTAMVDGSLFKPRSYSLLRAPYGELHAGLRSYPLQSIVPDYAGLLNLDLHYSGMWGKGSGVCQLTVDTLRTPWFEGGVKGTLGVQDTLVSLEDLQLVFAPGEAIYARGEMDFNQNFTLSVSSDPLQFNSVTVLRKTGVAGLGSVNANLFGTLSTPQGLLDLMVDSIKMSQFSVEKSFKLHAELTPTDVTATMDGAIQLLAQYNLERGTYSASIAMENYDISNALRQFVAPRLEGVVTLTSSLSGNPQGLELLTLHVPKLNITEDSLEVLDADTLALRYANDEVRIDSCKLTLLKEGSLVLSGSSLFGKTPSYNLSAEGVFPLKMIDFFTDVVGETSGDFLCDVDLTGTPTTPHVNGTFSVKEGVTRLSTMNQYIKGLHGSLRFKGNHFSIDTLTTNLDAGEISLHGGGFLSPQGIDSALITLNLHQLNLQLPGEGEITFNGNVQYANALDQNPKISGEIELLEGLYYKNINLLPELSKGAMSGGSVQSFRQQKEQETRRKNPVELKIKLLPRGSIVVDNNMAYMEVVPDIMLVGTADKPLLEGRATVENGEVSYLSTIFTIDRGIIDFTNPYKIASNLSIDASSQIDKYLVTLKIEGDPENDLRFTMSSTPPLKDEDIVSLIVFGVVGQDIGSTDANESTALIITQLANRALENSGVPIDKLAVEMDNNNGYFIQMGMNLSQKLSAELSMDTRDNEVVQRTDLRYMIIENLLLRGYITTKGESGVDMGVKFEKR